MRRFNFVQTIRMDFFTFPLVKKTNVGSNQQHNFFICWFLFFISGFPAFLRTDGAVECCLLPRLRKAQVYSLRLALEPSTKAPFWLTKNIAFISLHITNRFNMNSIEALYFAVHLKQSIQCTLVARSLLIIIQLLLSLNFCKL